MEFGERKRRRKSQSFKLVTDEDCDPPVKDPSEEPREDDVWLGDDGMEIKKQITGMMRLLTDKTGRVYHRVEVEQDGSSPTAAASKDQAVNNWDATPCAGSSSSCNPNPNQCGTSSADLNKMKDVRIGDINVAPRDVQGNNCCTCSCKGTLNSILYELRAMRRLMQTHKASLEAHEPTAPPCHARLSPVLSTRRRRRQLNKATPGLVSSPQAATVSTAEASPSDCGRTVDSKASTPTVEPAAAHNSLLSQPPQATGVQQSPEVRLAEDHDVFISKAQLDSILVNYTRSGSLLFRKLVCAFFNDAVLANSLPNGKRKRGLNDHRKGLDQNIVGAIKVFTEKYCIEHNVDKLPGPRDWVQILQDQIKLARKRLKRDAVETENPGNAPLTSMNKNPTESSANKSVCG